MKCMRCGAEFSDDLLVCPRCGLEIQIVPDYNPLDDVLAAQVRGAVNGTYATDEYANVYSQRRNDRTSSIREGQDDSRENMRRTAMLRNQNGRTGEKRTNTERYASSRTGKTGQMRNGTEKTGYLTPEELRERQKKNERRKQLARRKKKKKLILLLSVICIILIAGVAGYLNSYTGKMNKGYQYLKNGEYQKATECFKKAVSKNPKKGEAYEGLAKVCLAQNDTEGGEEIFLNAIKEQPSSVDIYRKAIEFYVDTDQKMKVSVLLDACSVSNVLNELSEYISEEPEYSLDDMKEYEEIQALELTGSGEAIYYTTDGTDPTESSIKYTEPIRLDEGTTEVRAISVNKKGIPSLVVKKTYTIQFPIEDAPSVTPSTGAYDTEQVIEVVVPENYEAYYTTDGSDPDPDSSSTKKYEGPIDMPVGSTTFKVVLANKKGRLSDVTIRKYELSLSE